MTEIDLRQLTTMMAIAEEGTFSRAANRLGYTQSSISQHVAALERVVGGSVFDRPDGPRPVRARPRRAWAGVVLVLVSFTPVRGGPLMYTDDVSAGDGRA